MQVATSGSILLGGNSQGANAVIPSADYTLSSPTLNFSSHIAGDRLDGRSAATVVHVRHSPIPEPEHIMLLCVGVLLAGMAIRRRWRRESSAASVA